MILNLVPGIDYKLMGLDAVYPEHGMCRVAWIKAEDRTDNAVFLSLGMEHQIDSLGGRGLKSHLCNTFRLITG